MTNSKLKESFKELFLAQGHSDEKAEKMAELATSRDPDMETSFERFTRRLEEIPGTKAKATQPHKAHPVLLKESFKEVFILQGHTPEEATRMAETAARGR